MLVIFEIKLHNMTKKVISKKYLTRFLIMVHFICNTIATYKPAPWHLRWGVADKENFEYE